MSGKYHPTTANEAGGIEPQWTYAAFLVEDTPANEAGGLCELPEGFTHDADNPCPKERRIPSKPCPVARAKEIGSSTLVNEHCFCVTPRVDPTCCWCQAHEPLPATQPVPGHGLYRTELKRE